jgi:hypothetical protein
MRCYGVKAHSYPQRIGSYFLKFSFWYLSIEGFKVIGRNAPFNGEKSVNSALSARDRLNMSVFLL